MKNLFLLLFVISLGTSVNAQEVKKAEMKSKSKIEKGTMTPFNQFYGKKLSVVSHSKDKQTMGHQESDYILLNENGTYQQDFNGTKQEGKWTYNKDSKTITITTTEAKRWVITESNQDNMTLTQGTEILKEKK